MALDSSSDSVKHLGPWRTWFTVGKRAVNHALPVPDLLIFEHFITFFFSSRLCPMLFSHYGTPYFTSLPQLHCEWGIKWERDKDQEKRKTWYLWVLLQHLLSFAPWYSADSVSSTNVINRFSEVCHLLEFIFLQALLLFLFAFFSWLFHPHFTPALIKDLVFLLSTFIWA